jgi:type IV pilus assembly protein PilO
VRDLAQTRRRLLGLAIALGVIVLAGAIFLLTPYGRSRERLQQDYETLRLERQRKEAENGPLANIDEKLLLARRQIDAFYRDRLPAQYSDVSAELTKLASESHVRLGQVKYDMDKDAPAPGVRSVRIGANVTGDYKNIVKFINALERDRMVFEPTSVQLTEGQQGVTLEMKLNTYLREGAAGGA